MPQQRSACRTLNVRHFHVWLRAAPESIYLSSFFASAFYRTHSAALGTRPPWHNPSQWMPDCRNARKKHCGSFSLPSRQAPYSNNNNNNLHISPIPSPQLLICLVASTRPSIPSCSSSFTALWRITLRTRSRVPGRAKLCLPTNSLDRHSQPPPHQSMAAISDSAMH